MAFYSTKTKKVKTKSDTGRVYVLRVTLDDGTIVHKVGMCHSSRSNDRMMEILNGFHTVYRYVPMCKLRRDREFVTPHLVEKHLHSLLKDLSYKFDKKFGGSTEFFSEICEDTLLDYIDSFDETELLKTDTMAIKDYYAIQGKEKPPKDNEVHTDDIPF